MKVIKKNGTEQKFDKDKIVFAMMKSADRVDVKVSDEDKEKVVQLVKEMTKGREHITVENIHKVVERALEKVSSRVSESYRNYRNFKTEYVGGVLGDIDGQVLDVLHKVDRENSNTNTRYISTKRTNVARVFAKEMYKKMYLPLKTKQALEDGFIYIHDLEDQLLQTFNCILCDYGNIMEGGFEMEHVWYNEPKDIRTAVGQLGDLIMVESAQHWGGDTTPLIDSILSKYYKMTIKKHESELKSYGVVDYKRIAREKAYNEMKQSLQGLEALLNTVVNARGSQPFITFTFGASNDEYDDYKADVAKALLEVRMEGHGKVGFKKNMIFPKYVFNIDEELHGEGKRYEWLFNLSVKCSSENMYPDYVHKDHFFRDGKWLSSMGCRAYLSNWKNEEGENIFHGRANLGAVSLNLPLIFQHAKVNNLDFYGELDKYMDMIRKFLDHRYEYLGKAKASSNPMLFMQGGAYGGNLKEDDTIEEIIKSWTASFGITALHELTILKEGKSLRQTNDFAMEVMQHITEYVERAKKEDGHPYAIYNTPAESLCHRQATQFREMFGVIEGVSDKEYFTNSNHLWVGEEITPFEKQDMEIDLFKMSPGGHIGYVRIENPKNLEGLKAIILRGARMGFYQGVNIEACHCEDCGHRGEDFGDTCPNCGGDNLTIFVRINGYLGFKKRKGDTTLNDGKRAEIRDRKSM